MEYCNCNRKKRIPEQNYGKKSCKKLQIKVMQQNFGYINK